MSYSMTFQVLPTACQRILLPSLRSGISPPGFYGGCCRLRRLKKGITFTSFTFDSHEPRNLLNSVANISRKSAIMQKSLIYESLHNKGFLFLKINI